MGKQLVTEHHFRDLRKQIAELKEINEKIVFDYEDKNGNKEARSHIAKMRKSKTAVKNRHKEKKADALQLGRELDAAKNELLGSIDEMILVHKKPLDEIEERIKKEEDERVKMIEWDMAIEENDRIDAEKKRQEDLEKREAEIARKEAEIKASEFARAEAERIEKEKIERERLQKEREEKIRKEAAEKAELDKLESERKLKQAEEDAKKAAEDAERKRLADIQAETDRLELEHKRAIEQAKKEEAERERVRLAKIAEEKAIEDSRIADVNHRKKINNAILKHFLGHGVEESVCKVLICSIYKNEIPNISINY